jgi:hypothetical protein
MGTCYEINLFAVLFSVTSPVPCRMILERIADLVPHLYFFDRCGRALQNRFQQFCL